MKRALSILMILIMVFYITSCSILRNSGRIVDALKNPEPKASRAAAPEPEATEPSPSEDGAVSQSQEPAASAAGPAENVATGWPKEIPAYFPVFSSGTFMPKYYFKGNNTGVTNYSMRFSGVTLEQAKEYGQILKNAGINIYELEGSDLYSITGTFPADRGISDTVYAVWKAGDNTCSVFVTLYSSTK